MKIIILSLVTACLLVLTSCAPENVTESTDDMSDNTYADFKDSFTVNVISETNYKISKSEKYAGEFYVIYDMQGDIIDEGYHDGKGSLKITQAENIITVEEFF